MPLKKISKATWDDVIAEEKKLRIEFGKALIDDYDNEKLSLRKIAVKRNIGYETVRKLIAEARCNQDVSRVA